MKQHEKDPLLDVWETILKDLPCQFQKILYAPMRSPVFTTRGWDKDSAESIRKDQWKLASLSESPMSYKEEPQRTQSRNVATPVEKTKRTMRPYRNQDDMLCGTGPKV
jgi:hypothetical protein